MKACTLTGAMMLWAILAWGQSLQPMVLSSGGGGNTSGTFLADYTIGQIAIATANGTDQILTQGFQQPADILDQVVELPAGWLVSVFPNPADSRLFITAPQMPFGAELRYEFIDLAGRILQRGKFTGPDLSLDVSDLPASLYFLRLREESGASATLKIQIQ